VNYDNSLVVTITVTCCSWAHAHGRHLRTATRVTVKEYMSRTMYRLQVRRCAA